jgi:anti-anti-sigma factor
VQITKDENSGVVRIQGALSIGEVAEMREALCHSLSEKSNLVLDLSAVESCDTAALQLLCSARKTVDSRGQVRLVGLCGAVVNAAAALGLEIGELTAEGAVDSVSANEAKACGL